MPAHEELFTCSTSQAIMGIVSEHLKPCMLISEVRRFIPYRIFSHVRDYPSLDRMSADDVRAILGPGFPCNYYSIDKMEM